MTVAIPVSSALRSMRILGRELGPGSVSTVARRTFSSSGSYYSTWGFIGLGRMGTPMARNLRANLLKGDILIVHDCRPEAAMSFVQEDGPGAHTITADTPHEVAAKAETIVTALPAAAHVRSVFDNILGTNLAPLTTDRLFVDCSTIDPNSSREIAKRVNDQKQGHFVDAPMSGGVIGAREGTLTFMLGASSQVEGLVERATLTLLHMGRKVLHMGEQGMGVSAKLTNNYILAISNIAVAEAMNLGLKAGLDSARLGELINSSSGHCWSSAVNNPVPGISPHAPSEHDFEDGFAVSLMKKDLQLAMEAAGKMGARLEMANKARDVYKAVETVYAGKDASVVFKWLAEAAV